ncbi:MAG: ABC transporter ATP-binding protein [Clostridia bacterium]|nr:ABC transporter ATP-binding protein [Clostridia bacterium]
MIEVKNVTKSFDGFKALDELSLHVDSGTVYGLVGANGAGKTTVIKHMTGVYRPDSGSVTILDAPVYENIDLKKRVICIGDDLYFYPTYSILDMAKVYAGLYPSWDWERFYSLKEVFPIDIKRKVRKLSKGMQKQVAFWIGICTKPDVMILDEPVDGLDPVMRRNVWKLMLQEVAERNMTVLVSSHNLRELEDVCDHVGIIHQGKVVLEKSLDDAKGNIHKVQVAFGVAMPDALKESLTLLHEEQFGSVYSLIVKGNVAQIKEEIAKHSPLLCDILPLTLEEVFIYELGGVGYETANIIL